MASSGTSGTGSGTFTAVVSDWKNGVVSTVAGDGKAESRDGIGVAAGLRGPCGLVVLTDGKSLVFSGIQSNQTRRYSLVDEKVSTLIGRTGMAGFKNGDSKSAALACPFGMCADPLKPNNLFIGDQGSIRYWDTANDQVTLIAGDAKEGYADGVGSNARFFGITGLLCHPNGKRCTCRTE